MAREGKTYIVRRAESGSCIVLTLNELTGKASEMTLPTTPERIGEWISSGRMIQDALPELSAAQREFLLTGLQPEEWDALVGREG